MLQASPRPGIVNSFCRPFPPSKAPYPSCAGTPSNKTVPFISLSLSIGAVPGTSSARVGFASCSPNVNSSSNSSRPGRKAVVSGGLQSERANSALRGIEPAPEPSFYTGGGSLRVRGRKKLEEEPTRAGDTHRTHARGRLQIPRRSPTVRGRSARLRCAEHARARGPPARRHPLVI